MYRPGPSGPDQKLTSHPVRPCTDRSDAMLPTCKVRACPTAGRLLGQVWARSGQASGPRRNELAAAELGAGFMTAPGVRQPGLTVRFLLDMCRGSGRAGSLPVGLANGG